MNLDFQKVFGSLIHQKYKLPSQIKEFLLTTNGRCVMKGWIFSKDTNNAGDGREWGWFSKDIRVTPVIIDCSAESQTDGYAIEFADGDGNMLRVNGLEDFIKVIEEKIKEIKKEFSDVS